MEFIKHIHLSLIVFVPLILLVLVGSCEEEDDIKDLSNKIELVDFTSSEISYKTAQVSSKIPENYGLNIEEFGHCWSLENNPDIDDSISVFSEYTSYAFTSLLEDLTQNSIYYVRSYLKFGDVVYYSETDTFKTKEIKPPTITTTSVTDLTAKSAMSGGIIFSGNGAEIIARGVCWNTSGNPSLTDSFTNDGLGLGVFESNIENLNVDTKYYIRAYATNGVGTGYGDEIEFITNNGLPKLSTVSISEVTYTSLKSGGNIITDDGFELIEKGICWNKTGSPTVDESKINAGSGSESFTCSVNNLTEGETYYIRAYAINEIGIAYGNELNVSLVDGVVSLKDYDGNWYKIIKIGSQVWMRENLKTTHYANGEELVDGSEIISLLSEDNTTKYWCNPLDDSYKQEYGLLYTWAAAMNGSSGSDLNPSMVQGVCPDGWHIPSSSEFSELILTIGSGSSVAGGLMKEAGYNHWEEPNAGATNESGFTALPAGIIEGNGYRHLGQYIYFWTTNEASNDSSKIIGCSYTFESTWHNDKNKSSGYSVRCLKD